MDDLNRDLADGMLGWDQADRAMGGDLTGAYRDAAARERLSMNDDRRASQGSPAPARALIIAAAMIAVILILVAVG